jgi:exodeoxyribonuclease VII large subunit
MQLAAIERDTVRAGRSLLRRREDVVAAVGRRVHRAGTVQIDGATASVDRMASVIGATALRSIDAARAHVADLERRMELLDPQRLLARGWSITRTAAGDLVMTPAAAGSGIVLRTTVAGGDITSVVTEETDNGR